MPLHSLRQNKALKARVELPPSASGIRRHGRSRRRGASMPGHEQCPMQTGRDLGARGDQCGRGTRTEYDRRGKYSLYLGNELLPKMPYSASGRRDGDTQDNNALGRIYRTILNEQNFLLPHPTLSSHFRPPLIGNHTTVNHLPTFWYPHVIAVLSFSDCRYVLPFTSGGRSRRRGASMPGHEQ